MKTRQKSGFFDACFRALTALKSLESKISYRFESGQRHQSNIIRIVYSSRVSGSDLLFILKICNKKRELADFTPQALVPFLSVSNGKPFRFRPQWRYPCVNQWDHSYLIFY